MSKMDALLKSRISLAEPEPSAPVRQPESLRAVTPPPPKGGSAMDSLLSTGVSLGAEQEYDDQLPGVAPTSPIKESPLSVMERAMLGWVRTPEEQEKLLRGMGQFDDVKRVERQSGSSFSVKKAGKWFDVDPNFEWSMKGVKDAVTTGSGLSEMAGDLAQGTGEYGLRAAGAAVAGGLGLAAAAAAAPVAAVGAPLALLAAGSAGALGAASGAAGAEALDLGVRKAAQETTGETAGSSPYNNPREVMDQLAASALFGIEDFAAGKGIQLAGKGISHVVGGIVKRLSNTPEGRAAVKKMFGLLGADEIHVEARLRDPARNARFDDMAVRAELRGGLNKSPLDEAEDAAFSELERKLQVARAKQGAEFAQLEARPEVRAARINNGQAFATRIEEMASADIVKPSGVINQSREFATGDKRALNFVLRNAKNADQLDYRSTRALIKDIGRILDDTGNSLSKEVKRHLTLLKNDLDNNITSAVGKEAGEMYGNVKGKYRAVNDMAEALQDATNTEGKKLAFIRKLSSPNRNEAKEAVAGLIQGGIPEDDIVKMLQIQGSREALRWFGKGRIMKYIPAPGPKLAAKAITAGSAIKQGVKALPGQTADALMTAEEQKRLVSSIPYAAKLNQMLKGLPVEQRSALLSNPQTLDILTGIVAGGVVEQENARSTLMQGAGLE